MNHVAVALLFALCACTGKSRPASDNLVVVLADEPATLDPRYATDASGQRIGGLIFNSLIRVGNDFKPEPEAAESWTQKGSSIKFVLRPDLTFHNGRPLRAEDVEYSFALYRRSGSPFASMLDAIKGISTATENDRITVNIDVAGAAEKFMISDLPAVKLLPRRESEAAGEDFRKVLIGTGPFRYVGRADNEIRLESVRARIPKLTFKIVRDDLTRFQKVRKGEVDIVQSDLPPAKIRELEALKDRLTVIRYPGLSASYILINMKDPALARKDVREALARSLKRREIIDHKLFGLAKEANSILTPNNPYYNDELSNPSFDLKAAQTAIARAGLKGHRLILKTSNSPQAVDNGAVLSSQLSASGLDVRLQSYEWGTFYDDVKKGNFQLATMRWVGTVDPDIYRLAFHSRETPPGRNRGSYINQRVDRLLDQASAATSSAARKILFKEIQTIVHHDLAILPLWYDEQVAVVQKGVEGFKPNLLSDFRPYTEVSKN